MHQLLNMRLDPYFKKNYSKFTGYGSPDDIKLELCIRQCCMMSFEMSSATNTAAIKQVIGICGTLAGRDNGAVQFSQSYCPQVRQFLEVMRTYL